MSNTACLSTKNLTADQRKVRTAKLMLARMASAAKREAEFNHDNGATLRDLAGAMMIARLDVVSAEMEEFMNRVRAERAERAARK